MKTYVILLRGINVGGKNTISMKELKLALETLGYANVQTYINSGNVILSSKHSSTKIAEQIEDMLPKIFNLDSSPIKVLVLSHEEIKAIIANAPKGFGTEPAMYYSDVIFLIGISTKEALPVFLPREGVDRIWPGDGVIYSQRLGAERVKSRLGKIIGTPPYKRMTIRSWSTTTKLLSILEELNNKTGV